MTIPVWVGALLVVIGIPVITLALAGLLALIEAGWRRLDRAVDRTIAKAANDKTIYDDTYPVTNVRPFRQRDRDSA